MFYEVHGGFKISRVNGVGVFNAAFWRDVEDNTPGLSTACGCYIFAIRFGNKITPHYVGKTEKQNFKKECFQPTKISYYNEAIKSNAGTPILFLIARVTKSRTKYSTPTKRSYRDIDFLETMFIGMAIEMNKDLYNLKKTKMLREMTVPGIINSTVGAPSEAQKALKRALGV